MACKRLHIFYSGRVQGVGFRYTTRNIASELGLRGWVKNLSDGRVEVMCEGQEEVLQKFLKNIEDNFVGRYILDRQISWQKPTKEYKSFEVTF